MKRALIFISLFCLGITACEDTRLQSYVANVPVYMSYEELRSSFSTSSDEPVVHPGKIYFKDHYMYINEHRKGIHVVDLTDPSDPSPKVFITVPGNVDMAIRNDILFADSYTDLMMIDISDPVHPEKIKRLEALFEYVIPPYDNAYPLDEIDEEKGVVTGYEIKEITREVNHHPYPYPVYYDGWRNKTDLLTSVSSPGGSENSYGTGGSMARFITYDDYLYALESTYKLQSINISDADHPVVENEQYLWGNVETIFIAEKYMYVGTSNGMHILSLQEPSVPTKISTYQHMTACDPVVVEGNRAYVTLRAGNRCGGDQNLLEVIDISNKYNPLKLASFGMTEPYGLGIDNGTLFVCEGDHGLKVYDVTDPMHITANKIAEFNNIHAYDVIPMGEFLFMTGDDGFYIYDYSNLQNITLEGTLPVVPQEE